MRSTTAFAPSGLPVELILFAESLEIAFSVRIMSSVYSASVEVLQHNAPRIAEKGRVGTYSAAIFARLMILWVLIVTSRQYPTSRFDPHPRRFQNWCARPMPADQSLRMPLANPEDLGTDWCHLYF